MTDTEMNLRVNTLIIASMSEFIFSWLTPYPWWQDGLIVLGSGLVCSLVVGFNR